MQPLDRAPTANWQSGQPAWRFAAPATVSNAPATSTQPEHDQPALKIHNSSWTAEECNGRSTAHKRSACNECKQQKLRCDLSTAEDASGSSCSRCAKLGLECRIDDCFKRTRKRKRSIDFEAEINALKERLSRYGDAARVPKASTPPASMNGLPDGSNPDSAACVSVDGAVLPAPLPNETTLLSPDPNSLPATTTRPHEHELQAPASTSANAHRPRSFELGNVSLSVEEVEELFAVFFAHYHPYMLVLNPQQPPHIIYESSPILFWSIVSVAARRNQHDPTLLARLAQIVIDLLWNHIRSMPHSVALVQSILLLCIWPFPTSSSATDPSYMLVGIAVHAALQMGLHRPMHLQDFTKYRVKLSEQEIADRIQVWSACNIVAQSVSIGVGLQGPAHLQDWASVFGPLTTPSPLLADSVRQSLQVELFRNKVTQVLATASANELMIKPVQERLPLYRLLGSDLCVLEANLGSLSEITRFPLLAASLHLQSFYLFDDATTPEYDERILELYSTSSKIIELALELDQTDRSFTQYCPFHAYQIVVSAALVLLKVLKNEHFSALVIASSGKTLFNYSISVLRRISVSNNDLPARLSDVLAYLWNHPNPRVVGEPGREGLELKIKSRMSMSIVYDSLWRWRDQFTISGATGDRTLGSGSTQAEDTTELQADSLPPLFQFEDMTNLSTDDLFLDWFK